MQMEELSGLQRDLLYIILDSDKPSGQDINRSINEEYKNEVNHGRLYPNLDELVELGLIIKGNKNDRANYYEITQKGKDEIVKYQEWTSERVDNLIKSIN